MAGFEVVVRPVVFPDIRPSPPRSLPPQDDPTKGFAVIKGNGAKSMTTSESFSMSMSKSRPMETERRSDEVTIYQQDDDGTVNRDNFVKMNVANRIKMRRQEGDPVPPAPDAGGLPRPQRLGVEETSYYKRVEPSENVEIGRVDIIEKNPAAGESE
jgi:hypothetical protein